MKKLFYKPLFFGVGLLVGVLVSGCSTIPDRETISAKNFPTMKTSHPRSDMEQINFVKLRKDPELEVLDTGDVLGIYIGGITGPNDQPPPIHNVDYVANDTFRDAPASGYPYEVREDGTISLPLLDFPIDVRGCTLREAELKIRDEYTVHSNILVNGGNITVSLIKRRTVNVTVIREDVVSADMRSNNNSSTGKGESYFGSAERGSAYSLQIPVYRNDVLEALSQTGGLPGLNAKNEVVILRKAQNLNDADDDYISGSEPGQASSVADRYNANGEVSDLNSDFGIIRIPLRISMNDVPPPLTSEDVTLENGDVVFIQSRDAEVFYTGGMIKGGVYPIPRDYDLDVVGAIATAGGSIGAAAGSAAGYSGTSKTASILPPSRVLVIREINGRQYAIKMRQKDLFKDSGERLLIQPNDVVLVEYTNFEFILNVVVSTVTFRLDTLFD